uniref:Uncharacterized protein n=1 Tax=Callorhinchus milii TaxID=7868 RepID=A0A4W3GM81_CALMI
FFSPSVPLTPSPSPSLSPAHSLSPTHSLSPSRTLLFSVDETSFEAGIRVQIHSQDEPPYIHELGFGVPPGFQTFVSCQEQRLTYLPEPWGNCKSELPNSNVPGYVNYSITACRLNCEKQAVLKACGCRMVHMPGTSTASPPAQCGEQAPEQTRWRERAGVGVRVESSSGGASPSTDTMGGEREQGMGLE